MEKPGNRFGGIADSNREHAELPTRPCLSSVWRRRWKFSTLPSAVKPAGSQKPTGSCTPSSLSKARSDTTPRVAAMVRLAPASLRLVADTCSRRGEGSQASAQGHGGAAGLGHRLRMLPVHRGLSVAGQPVARGRGNESLHTAKGGDCGGGHGDAGSSGRHFVVMCVCVGGWGSLRWRWDCTSSFLKINKKYSSQNGYMVTESGVALSAQSAYGACLQKCPRDGVSSTEATMKWSVMEDLGR